MKKLFQLLAGVFLLAAPLFAQTVGPISVTGSNCATIGTFNQAATVGINVSGTWSTTLLTQGTIQGQSAFTVQVTPAASTTLQSNITANGAYVVSVAGLSTFQICGSSLTGTATIYLNASQGFLPGAPSTGGTVTAVTGSSPILSSGGTAPDISCPTCSTATVSGTINNVGVFSAGATIGNSVQNAFLQVSPALPPSGFWVGGTSNALRLQNTTPATSGITHASSQLLNFCGNIWDGAASQQDCWYEYSSYRPAGSANPRSTLVFTHNTGGTSGAKNVVFSGDNTGSEGTAAITFGYGLILANQTTGTGMSVSNSSAATGSRTGYEMFSTPVGCASMLLDRSNNVGVNWSLNIGTTCTGANPFNAAVIYRDSMNTTGNVWFGGTDASATNGAGGAAFNAVNAATTVPAFNYRTMGSFSNCSAVGSAASPSLVACGASPEGAFSCATNASAATCVISTTAVTANSNITVEETSAANTRLSVTCNTAPSVVPAILVASISAGTSFTINMPTITTNPACFYYRVSN